MATDTPQQRRGDNLQPEAMIACPQCSWQCFEGVRGDGVLIAACPRHGTFVTGRSGRADAGSGRMNPEERLWLLVTAVDTFLADPGWNDFIIVQTSTLGCHYAELRFIEGRLCAEVCSRQWGCCECGDRPLQRRQRAALLRLGYAPGGLCRNFFRTDVRPEPLPLALLLEHSLLAAYDEPYDFEIRVFYQRRAMMRDLLLRLSAHSPS